MSSCWWKICQRKYSALSALRSSCSLWYLSASFFCSCFCLRSTCSPFLFVKAKLVFSSALILLASSSSNSFLKASEPEICSMSCVSSLGPFAAMDSISPWNTREFLALVMIPKDLSLSLYASHPTVRLSILYSDVPCALMILVKCTSFPSAISYASLTKDFDVCPLFPPSPLYTRSFNAAPRNWLDLTPKTKLMASIRLDFPDPFGPTMAVKFRNGPIT
mmetsp:Transcript_7623/g.47040  ORF Transcript_7623/g.47040 Transcript_7623/m.47040 type:complete len:219 (+) Transcript_7623:3579-4235(+)